MRKPLEEMLYEFMEGTITADEDGHLLGSGALGPTICSYAVRLSSYAVLFYCTMSDVRVVCYAGPVCMLLCAGL